jgi:hypothetical protein
MQETSIHAPDNEPAQGCPLAHGRAVEPSDTLVFPHHKRVVMHYAQREDGQTLLHLHHREQEIIFDDPELFGFGERLASTPRFVAEAATAWGGGQAWSRIKALLEQLLEAGLLQRAELASSGAARAHGCVASPLPAAASNEPHTWLECEALTEAFGGRAIELGHLEVVLPIYRIAHPALDAEGRQVGEANVFPPALRLDVPTEWRTCQYAGSRFQDDYPMNVTALKAMIKHWKPMLAALARIRAAYVRRSEQRGPLSIGDVQRLSTLAMGVPAYLIMRADAPTANAALHPVWSSMFRICDGLRMAMHEMLFTPTDGEPRAPETPVRAAEIYPYAERKQLLLSEHGVCAGPKALIEEFVNVFVDGLPPQDAAEFVFDPALSTDLAQLPAALDYGLQALQVYAVVFALWPLVGAVHERLLELLAPVPAEPGDHLAAWHQRLEQEWPRFALGFLGDAAARTARLRAHADMYAGCARALGVRGAALADDLQLDAANPLDRSALTEQFRLALQQAQRSTHARSETTLTALAQTLAEHACRERALCRLAAELQSKVNRTLGRTAPNRPLTAADLAFHHRLRVALALPYLGDSLRECLGLTLEIDAQHITLQAAAISGATI